jgi:hypothetical protein
VILVAQEVQVLLVELEQQAEQVALDQLDQQGQLVQLVGTSEMCINHFLAMINSTCYLYVNLYMILEM